jgi:AbiV family abortive infection protein
MQDLSLEQLCDGMFQTLENACSLIEEATILLGKNKKARAYALAYTACEELGKIPMLLHAATRLALGEPVDWKRLAKRFRSHESKAMQFHGLDAAIPIIKGAVKKDKEWLGRQFVEETLDAMVVAKKAPSDRNSALYCDFVQGAFVKPEDLATEATVKKLVEIATQQLETGKKILGSTPEEAAARIKAHANPGRYNALLGTWPNNNS